MSQSLAPNSDLLNGIVTDVMTLVNRPDLEGEIEIAVKSATRYAHFTDFYPRDLATKIESFPSICNQIQLDVQSLFPRLRGFSTVRLLDVNQQPIEKPGIELVEIGDVYDPSYRTLKNNIAYLAGTSLNVRSSVSMAGLIVEYFQAPHSRGPLYNSWIAQLYPEVIIYKAAAEVFVSSGNAEKATNYMKTVENLMIPQLKANFLLSQSR